VLPIIIFAAVLVPLLVIAFLANRRRTAAGEHETTGDAATDAATQQEYEEEFAQAEAYQEQWREEQHKEHPDDRLY
jgi:hypothetical protein